MEKNLKYGLIGVALILLLLIVPAVMNEYAFGKYLDMHTEYGELKAESYLSYKSAMVYADPDSPFYDTESAITNAERYMEISTYQYTQTDALISYWDDHPFLEEKLRDGTFRRRQYMNTQNEVLVRQSHCTEILANGGTRWTNWDEIDNNNWPFQVLNGMEYRLPDDGTHLPNDYRGY